MALTSLGILSFSHHSVLTTLCSPVLRQALPSDYLTISASTLLICSMSPGFYSVFLLYWYSCSLNDLFASWVDIVLGFCCVGCFLSRTNWEFLGGHLKAVQLACGEDDIDGHATTWEAFSFSKLFCSPLTTLFLFCFPERGPRSCLATTLHLMCSLTPIYHAPLCIFSLEESALEDARTIFKGQASLLKFFLST